MRRCCRAEPNPRGAAESNAAVLRLRSRTLGSFESASDPASEGSGRDPPAAPAAPALLPLMDARVRLLMLLLGTSGKRKTTNSPGEWPAGALAAGRAGVIWAEEEADVEAEADEGAEEEALREEWGSTSGGLFPPPALPATGADSAGAAGAEALPTAMGLLAGTC